MATSTRMASLATVMVLTCALLPSAARADGDPASDTLLGQDVFYPYQPPVSAGIQRTLNAETAAARRTGFPIKVALIANPVDLGVIPDLFAKPQQYADFLDQEISFQGKQPLLVVMAAGYGTQGLAAAATSAKASLHTPVGRSPTALAQAAIPAIAQLAAAAGHPLKGYSARSQSSGDSSSRLPVLIGLGVAALVVGAALVALHRRRPADP
ncbi:MAG: hypothetical protein M3016_01315 [Actinomycetota bacterium]|nr:hypothetical protein [Actinomycetota bacterium]